jgi:hypothetical protein
VLQALKGHQEQVRKVLDAQADSTVEQLAAGLANGG